MRRQTKFITVLIVMLVLLTACQTDPIKGAYAEGDMQEVEALSEKLVEEDPDNHLGYYYLALVREEQGNWIDVRDCLQKVRELKEGFFKEKELDCLLSQAMVEVLSSDLLEVLNVTKLTPFKETITEAYELDNSSVIAQLLMGLLLQEERQYEEAVILLDGVLASKQELCTYNAREKLGPYCFWHGNDARPNDADMSKKLYYIGSYLQDDFSFTELINTLTGSGNVEEVATVMEELGDLFSKSYLLERYNAERVSKYHELAEQEFPYEVAELSLSLPTGYAVKSVDWIDEDRLLLGVATQHGYGIRNKKELRYYVYNLLSNTASMVYQLDGSSDIVRRSKRLYDGSIAAYCDTGLIIIDGDSYEVKQTIQLPAGIGARQTDISYDGTTIAYCGDKGLYVANQDFSEPRLLVKRQREDIGVTAPKFPLWSYDDQKIAYVKCGYECSLGIGVTDVSTGSNTFLDVADAYSPLWFHDNVHLVLNCDPYEIGQPLVIAETNSGMIKSLVGTKGHKLPEPSPDGKQLLYQEDVGLGLGLFVADVESGIKQAVCPYLGGGLYRWSPQGDRIVYAIGDGSMSGFYKTYLIQRK